MSNFRRYIPLFLLTFAVILYKFLLSSGGDLSELQYRFFIVYAAILFYLWTFLGTKLKRLVLGGVLTVLVFASELNAKGYFYDYFSPEEVFFVTNSKVQAPKEDFTSRVITKNFLPRYNELVSAYDLPRIKKINQNLTTQELDSWLDNSKKAKVIVQVNQGWFNIIFSNKSLDKFYLKKTHSESTLINKANQQNDLTTRQTILKDYPAYLPIYLSNNELLVGRKTSGKKTTSNLLYIIGNPNNIVVTRKKSPESALHFVGAVIKAFTMLSHSLETNPLIIEEVKAQLWKASIFAGTIIDKSCRGFSYYMLALLELRKLIASEAKMEKNIAELRGIKKLFETGLGYLNPKLNTELYASSINNIAVLEIVIASNSLENFQSDYKRAGDLLDKAHKLASSVQTLQKLNNLVSENNNYLREIIAETNAEAVP